MKMFDLSVFWEANHYAEPWPPEVYWSSGEEQAEILGNKLGIQADDFRDRTALAAEHVKGEVLFHVGTHCDAPIHFGPTCEGKPSRTIDELPIEDFYGDGVIIDVRHKGSREEITVDDIQKALADINYTIKPKDIVLIMTGMDKYIYTDKYLYKQPGMGEAATRWLIDQGVKLTGIDAYTWDRPFSAMVEDVKAGHKEKLFPAHFVGRDKEYYHIEKLCNLETVPIRYGFKVSAFPIKVKNGSAGYCRVVAMVGD